VIYKIICENKDGVEKKHLLYIEYDFLGEELCSVDVYATHNIKTRLIDYNKKLENNLYKAIYKNAQERTADEIDEQADLEYEKNRGC